ncbi:hypothetical protein HPT27_17735 [Permianibacter sp. IMCC34836]|uniref:ceramidase domain-containing protein n=1 Tax=Permianibacter fluminis TaxID=2738515 RepID=UPI001557F0B9|nr:ceramidase domain-containing protein [Permianibacter fluminis]NQD38861.1 hypothetical protein [Permianibacter fluminis]
MTTAINAPSLARFWRLALLVVLVVGSLLFMLSRAPFAQDLAYHQFADQRGFWSLANALNVLSNLPFLLVGIAGLRLCWRNTALPLRSAWLTFFAGVAAVSVGSGYYHFAPDNLTLVWDRLPMTIGFMGLFIALLAEYVSVRFARVLLLPALLVGVASVWYWHRFDDLRFYYWVQLMPMLMVPALMMLFRPRYSHGGMLLLMLGCYLLAKYVEYHDAAVFSLTGQLVSGHSIKHLLAALACYSALRMLQRRRPFSC